MVIQKALEALLKALQALVVQTGDKLLLCPQTDSQLMYCSWGILSFAGTQLILAKS